VDRVLVELARSLDLFPVDMVLVDLVMVNLFRVD
jgi:hypothetical protein